MLLQFDVDKKSFSTYVDIFKTRKCCNNDNYALLVANLHSVMYRLQLDISSCIFIASSLFLIESRFPITSLELSKVEAEEVYVNCV